MTQATRAAIVRRFKAGTSLAVLNRQYGARQVARVIREAVRRV